MSGHPVPGEPAVMWGRAVWSRAVMWTLAVLAESRCGLRRAGVSAREPGDAWEMHRERGQISLLILGFTVIALMLIVGAVDVTAVQLARSRLLDAADGAALDASDALDKGSAYDGGLKSAVPITDGSVRRSAAEYLAVEPRPHGISSWILADGTGSPDGQTAVVRLRGTADIPIAASVVAAFGGSVQITVESRARSGLR